MGQDHVTLKKEGAAPTSACREIPCAVCQSAQNGVFMLPGRDDVMTAGSLSTRDGWLLNTLRSIVQSLCAWTSMC